MADHRGLSTSMFKTTFDVRWDPEDHSFRLEAGPDGCPLLDDGQCSVHPVKPIQCRTFPFWPELLPHPQRMREQCEGVGRSDGEWFSWARMRRLAQGRGST
jgi:hypothetical protein